MEEFWNEEKSVADITQTVTLEFDFHIYDAESFPDGTFTYTLPEELDFSSIVGVEIAVNQDGAQIGYAVVDENNLMTFSDI